MAYTIVFDDVLTSKATKKTRIETDSMSFDSITDFVKKYNEMSVDMGNRDGFTKTVLLDEKDGVLLGGSLRYIPKKTN